MSIGVNGVLKLGLELHYFCQNNMGKEGGKWHNEQVYEMVALGGKMEGPPAQCRAEARGILPGIGGFHNE